MKRNQILSATLIVTTAIVAVSSTAARADDTTAKQALDQANALYAQRADQSKNDQAIQVLAAAEGSAQNSDLNFDILILESRALYWKGQHATSSDVEKSTYLLGQQKGLAARKINDSYAEGPYYAGINLARWGEANGIPASIQHKGELVQDMNDAMDPQRATRDGNDGATIDGYGPDRVLGRMYYKLPGILGGSHTTSVTDLTTAVQKGGNYSLNVLYLVDTLEHGNSQEQAQGKQMLANLLAQNPNTYNPDRLPETLEEFQMGRDYQNGKPLP